MRNCTVTIPEQNVTIKYYRKQNKLIDADSNRQRSVFELLLRATRSSDLLGKACEYRFEDWPCETRMMNTDKLNDRKKPNKMCY